MIFPYFPIKPSFTKGIFAMFDHLRNTKGPSVDLLRWKEPSAPLKLMAFSSTLAWRGVVTCGEWWPVVPGSLECINFFSWKQSLPIWNTPHEILVQCILSIFGIPHWRFLTKRLVTSFFDARDALAPSSRLSKKPSDYAEDEESWGWVKVPTCHLPCLKLGVSENSVPLNPMVNDHYPY
jgi:hypothetical protein